MFNKLAGVFYRGIKPLGFASWLYTPIKPEKERKLIENDTPKSTIPLIKYSLRKNFWKGRMVGKQKSSTRALLIHNWQVLSATLGHCYRQY